LVACVASWAPCRHMRAPLAPRSRDNPLDIPSQPAGAAATPQPRASPSMHGCTPYATMWMPCQACTCVRERSVSCGVVAHGYMHAHTSRAHERFVRPRSQPRSHTRGPCAAARKQRRAPTPVPRSPERTAARRARLAAATRGGGIAHAHAGAAALTSSSCRRRPLERRADSRPGGCRGRARCTRRERSRRNTPRRSAPTQG